MTIYFYKINETYGCFSNFSKHGFMLDNKYWATSEHYFQAYKFKGTIHEELVRNAKSPMDAANIGRDRSLPLRSDWDLVKDDVMRKAVHAKFSVHEDIKEILISTGDQEIVEKTTKDYYWGCGSDGTGKNMLGKILMEVRDKILTEI
ncbi:NADAR family protein [Chengkuizengella sp. SCS-71B]|uniref:NADAR family protein n=1 Tax=Chengkuizengella sp. SCS-71B TaxID=3115290 RepID=UPI0032C233E6